MTGETPERDVILAILRRYPDSSRGPSADSLAGEIRNWPAGQGGNPRCTAAGIRRQLTQLAAQGAVRGRVLKSGGPVHWQVTEKHRSPYNAAEVNDLAGLVEDATATAAALAGLAREMGREKDADELAYHAAAMHRSAGQLRRLARTITT